MSIVWNRTSIGMEEHKRQMGLRTRCKNEAKKPQPPEENCEGSSETCSTQRVTAACTLIGQRTKKIELMTQATQSATKKFSFEECDTSSVVKPSGHLDGRRRQLTNCPMPLSITMHDVRLTSFVIGQLVNLSWTMRSVWTMPMNEFSHQQTVTESQNLPLA